MFLYADPEACPACRAAIAPGSLRCDSCDTLLSGPVAQSLFRTLTQADGLVAELLRLSATSTINRTTPAGVPAMAGAPGPVPPQSMTSGTPPFPVAPANRAGRRTTGLTVASGPKVLLGLGALCLIVAAVVFLAVAWSAMGVGGRTGVLVLATLASGGAAAWLARRPLRGGAEAFATVSLGLLALDVAGARSAGWLDGFSDEWFAVLLGATVGGAALVAALTTRLLPLRTLWSTQVIAGLGALVTLGGLEAAIAATPGTVLVLALAAAGTWGAIRLELVVTAVLTALATLGWWLALLFIGLARVDSTPSFVELWARLDLWPLLVCVAAAALLAFPPRLPLPARVGALACAAAVATLAATLPAFDESMTIVAVVAALVIGAGATAQLVLPRAWRMVVVVPLGVAALVHFVLACSLAAQVLAALGRIDVWGGGFDVTLPAVSLAATEPLLLPLAVAGVCVAALVAVSMLATLAQARFDARNWVEAVGVVVAASAALLPVLYDVHAAMAYVVLMVVACGSAALALAGRRQETTWAAAAVAVTAVSAGLWVALANDVLTAIATGILAGTAVLGATRRGLVGELGDVAFAPAAAGFAWTVLHLLDVTAEWRAVPVIVVLGLWAITRPRVAREVPAVIAALITTTASLGMIHGAERFQSWLAIDLTVAGVVVAVSALVNPGRRRAAWASLALLTLAQWVRLEQEGIRTVEAYTLPLAVVLLVVGSVVVARGRASSVRALTSGLVLAIGPSLLLALDEPVSLRALLVGVGCLVAVVAGAMLRWSAPLVLGAAAGAVLVLREVGHADVLPQWVVIGLVGLALTALGVTWERSLAEVKDATARLRRMR